MHKCGAVAPPATTLFRLAFRASSLAGFRSCNKICASALSSVSRHVLRWQGEEEETGVYDFLFLSLLGRSPPSIVGQADQTVSSAYCHQPFERVYQLGEVWARRTNCHNQMPSTLQCLIF